MVSKSSFINELHFAMLFWSHWQIFFITIVAISLLFIENRMFLNRNDLTKITEKQKYKYLLLRRSALTYGVFTCIFYNGILVMWLVGGPNLMADDPLSISSLTEHSITPILFLLYFIISYRKPFIKNKFNLKLYIKYITKISIFPYMYIFFIGLNEAFINQGWYPYPELNPAQHGFIHILEIFILIPFIVMIINLDIIILNIRFDKIFLFIKRNISKIKIKNKKTKTIKKDKFNISNNDLK